MRLKIQVYQKKMLLFKQHVIPEWEEWKRQETSQSRSSFVLKQSNAKLPLVPWYRLYYTSLPKLLR